MKILNAFKIADRCIGLVLDKEVDFNCSRISINGVELPFNYVNDAIKSISIPIGNYEISDLIGKEAEFVA